MPAPADERNTGRVFRDVVASAIIGPLRVGIPLIGYALIYPLLLRKAGLTVLGIWSVMSTITVYIGMVDVGFSLLLTREAGVDRSREQLLEARSDFLAAWRAYVLVGGALVLLLLAAGPGWFDGLADIYAPRALLLSTVVLVAASPLQLLARLDASVLAARNDNARVLSVSGLTPLFQFAATAIGALSGYPIEGLASGAFLAAALQLLLFRFWLRRRHAAWCDLRIDTGWLNSLRRLRQLVPRSWRFFAISAGFLLREPVFRGLVAATLGAEQAGIYDIAMRAARSIRDLVTSGFHSLMPGLAVLHRQGQREQTHTLVRLSSLVLIVAGTVALGALVLGADLLFPLWLGETLPGLALTARILALWAMLTLCNVPYYHLLQATGHESVIARSVWLHTAAVLLLIPLRPFVALDLTTMVLVWTAAAVPTQAMIYYATQSRFGLLSEVLRWPRLPLGLAVSVLFFVAAWQLGPALSWPDPRRPALLNSGAALLIYLTAAGALLAAPLRRLTGR